MAGDDELLDEGEDEELNIVAIAIAAVVILGLIGGVVWFLFLRETPEGEIAQIPPWEAPENLQLEEVSNILPKMIINPSDSRGRYFLIVQINVAMNDRSLVDEEIRSKLWRLDKIKNTIIDIFSEYTIEELRMPIIKEETRQRIVDAMNEMVGWDPTLSVDEEEEILPPIKTIYFEEYILQ